MFNDALFSGKMKRAKRLTWLTLPISMLLHAMVIASLVVVPLLRADATLPKVKVFSVSIMAPPMPLPPSKGPGGRNDGRTKEGGGKNVPDTKDPPKNPVNESVLKAPIDVPEAIEEENLSIIGTGNGGSGSGGGGITDGFEEGDPNALFGPEKSENVDETLPALRIANVQMPKKIREVKPVYPPTALAARVQGRVIIEAMTDVFGLVRSTRIISSASPLLNEEALKAVKQWRYEPYIMNGIPKPVVFTVTITFSLAQ